jgi:P-type Mg2+ transporter
MAAVHDDPAGHRYRHRLTFSPLAGFLQLQALPLGYFPWLVLILTGYMVLTQCVKGWFVRRYGWQ